MKGREAEEDGEQAAVFVECFAQDRRALVDFAEFRNIEAPQHEQRDAVINQ